MYDRSGRWRDAAPDTDTQATGRGDRGGLLFGQPPDDSDVDDTGFINLYAPRVAR